MTDWLHLDAEHVWHPFTQAATAGPPLGVVSGQGAKLRLADGREMTDLISSWWVNLHGHAHPAIAAAIAEQAQRLEQVIFAGFTHQPAAELAGALAQRLPGDLSRIFYSDNGSTAVEVAVKLALQYWRNLEQPRQKLLTLDGAYHGDTFGAMSVGRSSGFYEPFEAWLFETAAVPNPHTYTGDPAPEERMAAALAWLDDYLEQHGQQTAAMILEPLLQGASGMRVTPPEFVAAAVRRVRAHGILVIFDEVLTGFWRTGRPWAASWLPPDCAPDLMCLSKGLTGGFLPLGVTAATPRIYSAFLGQSFSRAFAHGHSFTANPLSCAAALASLRLLDLPQTQADIARVCAAHAAALPELAAQPGLGRVRQLGTLLAADLTLAAAPETYGSQTSLRLRQFLRNRACCCGLWA
ncbi:adenosylmethionine--8-amino-7-oxononanoate transaminase [Deinococcus lacus]|uniref:Adenosylmethionine--8-amino-7-oxononanoate transaminase n=1 Tax=Deinococcus lacus TaxID=392561 RepID=A0ABW1YF97_9DEIO